MTGPQLPKPKRVPAPHTEGELGPRSRVHDVIAHFGLQSYILGSDGEKPYIIIYDKVSAATKRKIEGWFFITNGDLKVEWRVEAKIKDE